MDPQNIVVLIIIIVVVGLVAVVAVRSSASSDAPKIQPPKKDGKEDVPHVGVERMEVDAPVEINENMSLAEIKRAKAARVKTKGRRQTAVEATAEAEERLTDDHARVVAEDDGLGTEGEVSEPASNVEETSDVDAGWDLMDDDEPFTASTPSEPEEGPEPEPEPESGSSEVSEPVVEEPVGLDQMSESFGTPLSQGLERTRTGFIARLGQLFRRPELDSDLVEDLEEVLYTADVGPRAASAILGAVEDALSKDEKGDPEAVWQFVRGYVEDLLRSREEPLDIDAHNPFVILVIGVNGVGKTTTIGKMAAKFQRAGKKVLLVAGDTFRAAAVEQIEVWGKRAGLKVHTGEDNADPASVIFSGVERGVKEGYDVIICDTAGRLHTKAPLLDELEKISRVTQKVIASAPHETILVLDANTGQNAIQQAKTFREAVPITGIVLTKLDGTAKGGVILGICDELDAPIRYIGIGESVADLRQFDAREFTDALFM